MFYLKKWRACRRHRGFHSNLDRAFPMPLGVAGFQTRPCGQRLPPAVDLAGGEIHRRSESASGPRAPTRFCFQLPRVARWPLGGIDPTFGRRFFAVAAAAAGGGRRGRRREARPRRPGRMGTLARAPPLLPLTLGRNSTRYPAAAAPSWSSALRLAGGGAPSQKPRPRSPCKDTDAAKPKPKERGGGGRSAGPICCCACRLELCVRVWIEGGRRSSSGAASSWGTRLAGLGSVQGFGEGVLRAGRVGGG
mmetsp:Transcript_89338/g.238901  ORF Transcript_89338/g.238901 Transcript_89338/m.238901 type:complete len:249 (+) Transcript_89338:803-1549(+)